MAMPTPSRTRSAKAAAPSPRPAFTPVATRPRHDGWSPEKQERFVDALAASGCVREACAAVGMSPTAAYALRLRVDAQGFRVAWDAALDVAIRRLSDECFSRALEGEAIPHFYRGEQVGEHRRYDNRLAMFLLRYRDPLRYAATLDQMVYSGHPEQAALAFAHARTRMVDEAHGLTDTPAPPLDPPFATEPIADALPRQRAELAAAREEEARRRASEAAARAQAAEAELRDLSRAMAAARAQEAPPATRPGMTARTDGAGAATGGAGRHPAWPGEGRSGGDVPSASSTSAPAGAPGERRYTMPAPRIRSLWSGTGPG